MEMTNTGPRLRCSEMGTDTTPLAPRGLPEMGGRASRGDAEESALFSGVASASCPRRLVRDVQHGIAS